MARNRNFVNTGTRIMLQGLEGYYHKPKKEFDLEKTMPNWRKMNLKQIRESVQKNFIDNFTNLNGESVLFYEESGQHFYFRDGKSDVYTKGGLDFEVFEFLDRQQDERQKWRIETNNTSIDFLAGGVVFVAGERYFILKSFKIVTSGTGPNKFLAMRTPKGWQNFAIKLLAVI